MRALGCRAMARSLAETNGLYRLCTLFMESTTVKDGRMACRYGLIDRIVQPQDGVAMDEKNYEAILQKSQAQQRGGSRQPEGAEAGY